MNTLCTLLITTLTLINAPANKPVNRVDLSRFAGKWYSLYSIPTLYDKGSRQTTTTYLLNKDGYYNVVTDYKKGEGQEIHTFHSKLFPQADANNAEMKAQFIWPLKVDYWVIELADDYSYVVVGHPDKKLLFIMSRKPSIDKALYAEIVERCKAKGYDVEKLTSQEH